MKMKKWTLYPIIAGTLFLTGCFSDPASPDKKTPPNENFEFSWEVLRIFSIFQENLPADPYGFSSPKALYQSVGDPFTRYYDQDTALIFMSYLNTSSGGIGIMVDSVAAGIVIREVFAGSPGARAGLLKNDTIVTINGATLDTMVFKSRVNLLHGEIGAVKVFSVHRGGVTPVVITVTLGTYMAPSVFTDSLDSSIAVILITQFSDSTLNPNGTAAEFDEALAQTAWARYTILDLRENGGGLVDQSLDIAGQFVPSGTKIMYSKERYYHSTQAPNGATRQSEWSTKRMTSNASARKFYVLMDGYTASASEIVISCLRDHRPDIISVGTRTYGKARGQYVWYPTPDSGLAKVTYSLITPYIGAPYDIVGIHPVHEIADTVDALVVARDLIRAELGLPLTKRQSDVLAATGYNGLRALHVRRMAEPLAVIRKK